MNPEIQSALRWCLVMAAGWLVRKGVLTADQVSGFVGTFVGLGVLIWGVWNARRQKHAKVEAAADGIILGAKIADPTSNATLADAAPEVQAKVDEKVNAPVFPDAQFAQAPVK